MNSLFVVTALDNYMNTSYDQDLERQATENVFCAKCENHDHSEDCKDYCPTSPCLHDEERTDDGEPLKD